MDLARSLPSSDTAFHATEGDPSNLKLCQRGEWQDRLLVETWCQDTFSKVASNLSFT